MPVYLQHLTVVLGFGELSPQLICTHSLNIALFSCHRWLSHLFVPATPLPEPRSLCLIPQRAHRAYTATHRLSNTIFGNTFRISVYLCLADLVVCLELTKSVLQPLQLLRCLFLVCCLFLYPHSLVTGQRLSPQKRKAGVPLADHPNSPFRRACPVSAAPDQI